MTLEQIRDIAAFAIGLGTGTSIAALWLWSLIQRYALQCGNANCPHHRPRPTGRQH